MKMHAKKSLAAPGTALGKVESSPELVKCLLATFRGFPVSFGRDLSSEGVKATLFSCHLAPVKGHVKDTGAHTGTGTPFPPFRYISINE